MSHPDESTLENEGTAVDEGATAVKTPPKPKQRRRLYTSAPPAQPPLTSDPVEQSKTVEPATTAEHGLPEAFATPEAASEASEAAEQAATTARSDRTGVEPIIDPPISDPDANACRTVDHALSADPVASPIAPHSAAQTTLRTPTAPACSRSPLLRRLKSRQTIRDHALLAAGAMVIPLPFVDMTAEAAIQVRMVKRLAEIHGVDFAEKRAKALVAAAIGGFSTGLAAGTLLRYASFASYLASFWPSAALSSAITYGIGRLFEQHFEKGGRLDDLSPDTAARTLRDNARRLRATLGAKRAS